MGSLAVSVSVLTSGIWQTSSTILASRGRCLVVDPAYFPRELDALTERVAEIGTTEAVVFTHGHWDHVMGHQAFPDAPVWVAEPLARSIAAGDARARKYLDDAREFDSRWYVPRPRGHRWPDAVRGLAEGSVSWSGGTLRVLHLPGHSPDGLGLVAADVLLVGDYLSPCEIPFVEDLRAYRATVVRLLELLRDVREVIPGHGPRLSASEASAIARDDLVYLDRLRDARDDVEAAAIPLPRAADVVGMREHHLENCASARRVEQ